MSEKPYAAVALNVPIRKEFHYRIPPPLRDVIEVGMRVSVPFGRRTMAGYCVEFVERPEVAETKDIIRLVDKTPIVDERMLALTRWIASYYRCSWGEALHAVLPSGVRRRRNVKTKNVVIPGAAVDVIRAEAERLRDKSLKRSRVLQIVLDSPGQLTAHEISGVAGCTAGVVRRLIDKGLLSSERVPVEHEELPDWQLPASVPEQLTAEQTTALSLIRRKLAGGAFGVVLLHGVTGSGKTEVYLQTIEDVVASGKQTIVLVPEISLTPQTIGRFRARFKRVAVLHSRLTDGERGRYWRQIRKGEADVVVGARSAVFAPTPSLGLLVVDEEHENSFKQENTPRYHARDVGIMRAKREGAVVVLGSATPSLESYHNSVRHKYDLASLTRRVDEREMPTVEIVDMRRETEARRHVPILSRRLESYMRQCLARKEQCIVFLNRRGFSTYIHCPRCGFTLQCERCDITLTYHRRDDLAVCHYCNREVAPPSVCPDCNMPGIKYSGIGTEKIEEKLQGMFEEHKLLRMDSDTMRSRHAHAKALGAFRRGEVDILVGTQMIAKGLDFPNVTLVGVIAADTSIHLPDFRGCERTFQLLAQVAGRTGRGHKGGRVVVQTFVPDHYAVFTAASHDYEEFARQEMAFRQQLKYPPFSRMVRLLVTSRKEDDARERAESLAEEAQRHAAQLDASVLGPAPAPIAQIKGQYRWHVMLKAKDAGTVRALLDGLAGALDAKGSAKTVVDIDPLSML